LSRLPERKKSSVSVSHFSLSLSVDRFINNQSSLFSFLALTEYYTHFEIARSEFFPVGGVLFFSSFYRLCLSLHGMDCMMEVYFRST
jgi:hypothetical protein